MRREHVILFAVSLLILGMLAGCGGRDEPTATPVPTEAPAEAPTEAPTEAAAAEATPAEEEPATEEAAPVEEEASAEEEATPAEEEVAAEEEAPAEEAVTEEEEAVEAEATAEEEPAAEEAETPGEGEAAALEEAAEEVEAGAEEQAAAEDEVAEEQAAAVEEAVVEDEAAAAEGVPISEETPVAEETPAEEETPATEEAPVAEETPAAEEAPAGEDGEMVTEGGTEADATGGVTVESARAVADILNERSPAFTTISPDGTMMVYAKTEGRFWNSTGSACIYTFANANVTCYEVDSDTYRGYPPNFFWSPDSTRIAFTENPIQLGNESDIWIMNAADGTMTDMTDDGVVGSWASAEAGTFWLDYQPMWDEAGDLYFLRSEPTGDFSITFQLMKLTGGEGEAELVQDMSETLDGALMTWDIEDYFMMGPSSISPDGSKVAMVLQDINNPNEDGLTGAWLLDVESGELTQVVTYSDFGSAVPAWQEAPTRGIAVQWTGDSAGFVVLVGSWTNHFPMNVFYYVDADSGEITPVVDFSGVESMDAAMTAEEGQIPMRFYSPWTATVSPAGDKLFMLTDLAGVAGLLTSPLPPTGELPVVSGAAESYSSMGGTRSSTAETGKVVIYGYLLTTMEE